MGACVSAMPRGGSFTPLWTALFVWPHVVQSALLVFDCKITGPTNLVRKPKRDEHYENWWENLLFRCGARFCLDATSANFQLSKNELQLQVTEEDVYIDPCHKHELFYQLQLKYITKVPVHSPCKKKQNKSKSKNWIFILNIITFAEHNSLLTSKYMWSLVSNDHMYVFLSVFIQSKYY